jgi:site-specific DNA recombinase
MMAVTPVPTICGLYTRVSTRNQADTEYSSLETQREKLEAYCKSQDQYVIYRVYEDAGFSADTMNRPALKELLQDIRAGRITCVLAYKIDRLTRSVKDFHVLMDLFDRPWGQVCVHYPKSRYAPSHGAIATKHLARFCPI